MATKAPLNQYFFPNPYGDGVAYTVVAASLEEAQAQIQVENQVRSVPDATAEPAPTQDPAPVAEPSTAA